MGVKISRILHAGYQFDSGGTQIAFDPIFENPFSHNCYAFPDVRFETEKIRDLRWSAVFISHFHDDHCSLESLNFLNRSTPIFVYCLHEELILMIRELGFLNVQSLELDKAVVIDTFEVIPRRALDSDVDSIFHIKAAGLNILNVVDSWIEPLTLSKLTQTASWDMILWPFQTMREIEVLSPSRATPANGSLPVEWVEQLKILNPRYIVPSSCQFVHEDWSWYRRAYFPISYKSFQQEIESILPSAKVIRMNPSVSFTLNEHSLTTSPALPWIQPNGEQNIDYEYDLYLKPPSTSEISKRFAALNKSQFQFVYDYCRSGLVEKYRSLAPSEDSYFDEARLWRLSVYDHLGQGRNFYYRIKSQDIEFVSARSQDDLVGWLTEIPLSKFYAALAAGESLSSIYIRINDLIFEDKIEEKIKTADIMEDPLIRCLFTGDFGVYQRAQLERILAQQRIVT